MSETTERSSVWSHPFVRWVVFVTIVLLIRYVLTEWKPWEESRDPIDWGPANQEEVYEPPPVFR